MSTNKKTILFGIPGAFTPTSSQKLVETEGEDIDTIACISAMQGKFHKEAVCCELDLSDKPVGLGVRSRRYAMLVEDGVVKVLNLEEGGAFNVSSAEDLLNAI